MRTILRHVQRAARSLLLARPFSVPLITTVAAAIAIVTAGFAILYGIVLRPLPFPHDQELVLIGCRYGTSTGRIQSSSPPDFADRAVSRTLASTAAWRPATAVIGGASPIRVTAAQVTPRFFATLGVPPAAGSISDDLAAVTISDAFQRETFGAASAVGRSLLVDGRQRVITAVMPQSFAFPTKDVMLWEPLVLTPADVAEDQRGNENLLILGRLRPGATAASAQAEADVVTRSVVARSTERKQFLIDSRWRMEVRSLRDDISLDVKRPLTLLFLASFFVFTIGCANAAALVLARTAAKEKETMVRKALGASSLRACAPRLAEVVVATAIAAPLGLFGGWALSQGVIRLGGALLGRAEAIRFDAPVLAFWAFASLIAILLELVAASARLGLGSMTGGRFASVAVSRFRSALVIGEIALATTLLISCAVVVDGLRKLSEGETGFRPEGVLTFRLSAPETMGNDPHRMAAFFAHLQQAIGAVPGVVAVSGTTILPFSTDDQTATFHVEGRSAAPGVPTPAGRYCRVLPGWSTAMGIPLLSGRDLEARDDANAPRVAVIDETAAKQYWPHGDAVGRRLTFSDLTGTDVRWRTIVGIIGSVRHASLGEALVPHVYLPELQAPEPMLSFVVRSAVPPTALIPSIRGAIRVMDPTIAIDRVEPLTDAVDRSLQRPRLGSAVLSGLGIVALLLTAIGIYGLLAYGVGQRRREFAVRMAVGAHERSILQLVIVHGLRLTVIGSLAGIAAGFAASGALETLLVPETATTFVPYAIVVMTLVTVSVMASYLPARRAARLDPAPALRTE